MSESPFPPAAIIFGSAADPAVEAPGDINVAYTDDRAAVQGQVREWMEAHGYDEVPVSWYEASVDVTGRQVIIPVPIGKTGYAEILAGTYNVKWIRPDTIASLIWTYGDAPPRKLRRALKRPLRRFPWSLPIIPPPNGNLNEWIDLPGLRRAVRKYPHTRSVLVSLWGPLMGRLLDEDPRPSPKDLKRLRSRPSVLQDGTVELRIFRKGGIGQGRTPRPDELERMLYP